MNKIPDRCLPAISANRLIVILICSIILIIELILLGRIVATNPIELTDFINYINISIKALDGTSLYDIENLQTPFTAIFFIPLALLPIKNAFIVWSLLTILFYILLIWIVISELNFSLSPEHKLLVTVISLSWYPIILHVVTGQINIFIAFCIITSWYAVKRNNEILTGILLGLATLLKIFPAVLVLYFLINRRGKFIFSYITSILICLVFSCMIIDYKEILYYFGSGIFQNSNYFASSVNNNSLIGFYSRLLQNNIYINPVINSPSIYIIAIGITYVTVLIILFYQFRTSQWNAISIDIAFSLSIISILILSPVTWQHGYVLLVLPIGFLVKMLTRFHEPFLRKVSVLSLGILTFPDVILTTLIWPLESTVIQPWYSNLILLYQPVCLFLLFFVTIILSKKYNKRLVMEDLAFVS